MKVQDVLLLGLKSINQRKTRAILTTLMVVVGVASIIALVSQTTGIQDSITNTLQSLGPNTILVTTLGFAQNQATLTEADVGRLSNLDNVTAVIPIVRGFANMYTSGTSQTEQVSIIGISTQGLQQLMGSINVVDGSQYSDSTVPLALIGNQLGFPITSGQQQTVFPGQQLVLVRNLPRHQTQTLRVYVSGVLAPYGSTPLVPIDTTIFVPLQAALTMFHRVDYNMLMIKADSVDSVDGVATDLTNIYGNSAQVTTIQQITQTVAQITGQFGTLLGAIAAISLSVAALGIMNIMMVSVMERTHEIGILKAIGFKNRNVLTLFLSEASIIGVVGGLLGVVAGWGVSYTLPAVFGGIGKSNPSGGNRVASFAASRLTGFGGGGGPGGGGISGYTPVISPELVLISLVIAVTVAIAAGLYPAWRASRMEPIEALRHE